MAGKIYDVLAVGELNPDLIFTDINGIPQLGTEKIAGNFEYHLGSSTAIATAQMGRLGLDVALVSKIGKDDFGRFCKAELAKMHVETKHIIESDDISTGLTISLSYPEDRMLVTFLGSIAALQAKDVEDSLFRSSRHLHLSSFYLQKALQAYCKELFRRAKQFGLTVSLDTGDDPEDKWDSGIWEVFEYVDVFFPNKRELMGISRTSDLEAAVRKVGRKVKTVAVKLGAEGALLYHQGKITRYAPLQVSTVDTTGAGDSFDAGFIYGLSKGFSVDQSMKIANACGALATTQRGGPVGFNEVSEVLEFAGI